MQQKNLQLPDIEKVTELQHNKWVEYKRAKGFNEVITSGENVLVPYDQLSDTAKQTCRERSNMYYEAINEQFILENPATEQHQQQATTAQ